MCSNCSGDYENPDVTAGIRYCPDCDHDEDLHDSRGCQVRSLTFRCKCKRTADQLRPQYDRELRNALKAENLAIYKCGCINDRRFPRCLLHDSPIDLPATFGKIRHSIDSDTLQCECGAGVCFECAKVGVEKCTRQCGGHHGER